MTDSRQRSYGKRFEREVHTALKELEQTRSLLVHRFYDTYSAGDYLPAQPGDFLIIYKGIPILLELKGSCIHESLRACFSSAVTPNQIGSHILWNRAKASCWFLFNFNGQHGENFYELWPSTACISARETGKPLKLTLRYGKYTSVGDAIDSLLEAVTFQ